MWLLLQIFSLSESCIQQHRLDKLRFFSLLRFSFIVVAFIIIHFPDRRIQMAQLKSLKAECPYGNEIYAICINPSCRQPAVICQQGYQSRDECWNFHDNCMKVQWSRIEKHISHNPHVCSPDFHSFMQKMDTFFLTLLNKIRSEQSKFKLWVKTFGYSIDVMKFIKSTVESNFDDFTGEYLNPLVDEIMNAKRQATPSINERQLVSLGQEIVDMIERVNEVYLTNSPKNSKSTSLLITPDMIAPKFDSKIIRQIDSVTRLFDQKISDLELLYRASEHRFEIKEFHKLCDGHENTLVLIQTEFGKVIGGFTPAAWYSNKKHWAPDKSLKSFIFSLNMGQKFPLNLAQFAVANNPDKGPIFGCCDICIVDHANKERCNAQFPISYNNSKHVRSPDSSFAFTGHPKGKFLVKEWQVFQVTFQ